MNKDIKALEEALTEEDGRIKKVAKQLVKKSDVQGKGVVYRNELKLSTMQDLSKDTVGKVKDYLRDHLDNFKAVGKEQQLIIEKVRMQNSEILKRSKGEESRGIRVDQIVEIREKERMNREIKENLNMVILPNLNRNSNLFLNLDVQYDFIPVNEEYLRHMRLDFLSKKDKIVNIVGKKLTEHSNKLIVLQKSYQNDYLNWR